MDRQYTFNRVVIHARTQRCQSRSDGDWAYRGDNNTRCFIGIFIPDDHYHQDLEGSNITVLLLDEDPIQLDIGPVTDPKDILFLREIQQLHDWWEPAHWELGFESLARKYDLRYIAAEAA